ncbi:hypothetical protein ONS95_004371 [Cadophora gregata]|uniref:uncharacterized protein n=1 Tax=Cadophora gregata TaxID=51156 RepID=UPI0026DCAD07|nr:uncharacterized protein ONS95_004371 [Cadophora gregata]KAK0105238.1 hypothetical protein ONS96_004637 [Cadophora gregata f. sp. sojae]KAK0105857.1 hypothetical protein ONS95_004371 [Cadophora gregata]
MTAHQGTMSASMDVPHSQNTAPVLEFRCLYTADIRRKQKRWQDGRLKFHTFNKRVMVYDEKSNFVGDTHWKRGLEFEEGEELELERGGILVEVGECIGQRDQDLTELVDKRVKEREERAAAKVAQASPSASLVRNHGTPAGTALLRPKPLNSLLTPTGHYGRAVIPTTSPFEERQAAIRDENEPPAKRRKQNDTTSSRNGYAQNLMGATLSLSSSRPSSTPTIRYEPFRARHLQQEQPDAIVFTLDDDEERRASDIRRKIAQEQRAAIERPPPRQKKQKKSPPAKSGYASSLTGTPLMLSRSEVRPPVRTTLMKAPIQLGLSNEDSASESEDVRNSHEHAFKRPSHLVKKPAMAQARNEHVEQSSSEEEGSSMNLAPAPRRPSYTAKARLNMPPGPQDIQRDSSDEVGSCIDIEPSPKAPTKKTKVTIVHNNHPSGNLSFMNEEDSLCDMRTSPMIDSSKRKSKVKRPAAPSRPFKCDSSSAVEVESSPPRNAKVQQKQNQKQFPTTRPAEVKETSTSVQSRFTSSPRTEIGTSDLQLGGCFDRVSTIQNSSAAEATPDRSMAALRIKSRPRQKMMMLMNRPSSRPSSLNTSFEGSRPTTQHPPQAVTASDEVVLSQATIRLNTFSENQKAELEARLRRIRSKPQLDISSSDPDNGIDHTTIDLLLTRKPMLAKQQEEQVRRVALESTTVHGSSNRPLVASSGRSFIAETSGCVEVHQHSHSKEYMPTSKVASAENKGQQNHMLSKGLPSNTDPSDPKSDKTPPAAASHTNEISIPRSQPRLEVTLAAPAMIQRNSAELTSQDTRRVEDSMEDTEIAEDTGPTSTDKQMPLPGMEKVGQTVASDNPIEEFKAAGPKVLEDSADHNMSTERQFFSSDDESSIGNNPSNYDERVSCPAPNDPPGQAKDQSFSTQADVEVPKVVSEGMQSSTSRFRAMINPPSSAMKLPPRIASSRNEIAKPEIPNPNEGEPGSRELLGELVPELLPPAVEVLKGNPEPCSVLGFNTAATSAGLSTPDLASHSLKIGLPKARLANPATRGKSLQTLAANTSDTMATLFNPMPPPATRISSRMDRILERTNSDVDKTSETPLKEAPAGGPWSREAFDLFGIHGPPKLESGSGIPGT